MEGLRDEQALIAIGKLQRARTPVDETGEPARRGAGIVQREAEGRGAVPAGMGLHEAAHFRRPAGLQPCVGVQEEIPVALTRQPARSLRPRDELRPAALRAGDDAKSGVRRDLARGVGGASVGEHPAGDHARMQAFAEALDHAGQRAGGVEGGNDDDEAGHALTWLSAALRSM